MKKLEFSKEIKNLSVAKRVHKNVPLGCNKYIKTKEYKNVF